jgi:hypothetical protein
MSRMPRRLAACMACAAIGPAACGDGRTPLSASCTKGADAIEQALQSAPGRVELVDGTPLSHCVRDARSDAELQNVGLSLSAAADHLAEKAQGGDADAALGLGYLAGAARRGGKMTNGVGLELVRRVELRAGRLAGEGASRGSVAVRAAIRRGLAAGEQAG